ncbi:hypothetical protein GSbR_09170 [Geobacter sp. SVR]|nr:hypothetical protein GSVR_12410 [Geobacter sp. SVR]GCF84317.1 hypothetical protein GSbR_09170 [Geobacter sp. SVR]
MRAAIRVQAAPFIWLEAMATGRGKPRDSQTGVVSMAAPAPLMELSSEARNATEKMMVVCMRDVFQRGRDLPGCVILLPY